MVRSCAHARPIDGACAVAGRHVADLEDMRFAHDALTGSAIHDMATQSPQFGNLGVTALG
jgi:hypothetical protein